MLRRIRDPLALAGFLFVVAACAGPTPRDPASIQAIERGSEAYTLAAAERRREGLETIVRRFEAIARGETEDDTFDVLLFSGGAEWGAFGAGYMAQWSELGDAAAIPMPEFDMVGGISTGALMSAYVASGTPERYAELERFYRNVSPDWIQFRGVLAILSPATVSLIDNDGVRQEVEKAVDADLIDDLRQSHGDDRIIAIGTVNLDYGRVRYWDAGEQAANAADPEARVTDVLMAATAIAGIFPPVEIDGSLYADLGYVEGIPSFTGNGFDRFATLWRQRHGDVRPPTKRLWLIYNIPIGLEPEPVELSLRDLGLRGYQALVQASFQNPVAKALLLERVAEQHQTPPIEVRWIAIPTSFEKDPDVPAFDPRTANPLADLGREAAASPTGGWRHDLPQ